MYRMTIQIERYDPATSVWYTVFEDYARLTDQQQVFGLLRETAESLAQDENALALPPE